MSDKEQPTVFERHIPKPPKLTAMDSGKQPSGKQRYQAFECREIGNRAVRLRIEFHDQDRTASLLAHAYLVEVFSTDDCLVSLIFTSTIFTLEGENLGALLEALEREEVSVIRRFNPNLHERPKEDAPIITRIYRVPFEEYLARDGWTPPDNG